MLVKSEVKTAEDKFKTLTNYRHETVRRNPLSEWDTGSLMSYPTIREDIAPTEYLGRYYYYLIRMFVL